MTGQVWSSNDPRWVGVVILLAPLLAFIGAGMYLASDAEMEAQGDLEWTSGHLTYWGIHRGFWAAAVVFGTAGIFTWARSMQHPLATVASIIHLIGGVSGAVMFSILAWAPDARWYRDQGVPPDWGPALDAIIGPMWEYWEVSSYVGAFALGLVMLSVVGRKSISSWVTFLLVIYGYFFVGVPAGVFFPLIPLGIASLRQNSRGEATA